MLINFSIFPIGREEHLSSHVAGALEIIEKSGLPYQLTSMGTLIEGQWDEVMNVLKKCYMHMHEAAPRLYCTISVDSVTGAQNRLKGKVSSVEKKLGHKLKT